MRINEDRNCDSISEADYQTLVENSVTDIAENLVDLWDEIDDSVKKKLPEDLINLINQYKGNSESEA